MKPSGDLKINDMPTMMEPANDGEYTTDQLDKMLDMYAWAEKVDKDPKILRLLEDRANEKGKEYTGLFGASSDEPPADEPKPKEKPKSFADLGKIRNKKAMENVGK